MNMTTQQVANRYYELAKQNKWAEIWEELYAPEAVNREPEHAAGRGIPTITTGMDAIKAKSHARREMIQEIHAQYCSQPVVGGTFFSASMGRDVTFKGQPRMQLDEIAVFEVKDGKITLEQFFY
jgi:limonene-1,2-epoxide hydrolase